MHDIPMFYKLYGEQLCKFGFIAAVCSLRIEMANFIKEHRWLSFYWNDVFIICATRQLLYYNYLKGRIYKNANMIPMIPNQTLSLNDTGTLDCKNYMPIPYYLAMNLQKYIFILCIDVIIIY
jgi:hypothetical protein